MKILVLGASGQLGNCLKKISEVRNLTNISFPSEEEGNILDNTLLEILFSTENPQFVINCAAYTAVDKAEDDIETCRKVNKDGPENIANACAKHNTTLIHILTDFVFKGNTPQILAETAPTEPENIYGLTKLEGEIAISNILEKHFILRTSWLYSEYGNNFVKTMLRLGNEKKQLSVIIDQTGSPTYGMDLANAIIEIIESENTHYGTYHYSNEGITSWFDFARTIFDISSTQVVVTPVKTSEYITRAIRPAYSVLDKTKIKSVFNMEIPHWKESLESCIRILKSH